MGKLKTLDLGVSGSWAGQPAHKDELSPIALARSPSSAISRRQVSSLTPVPSRPALTHPCLQSTVVLPSQGGGGAFSKVLQLVRPAPPGSPAPSPFEGGAFNTVPLCCPIEVQSLLSQVLQPLRAGASSARPFDIYLLPDDFPDQGCSHGLLW